MKEAIKERFWKEKGYPRTGTQNYGIIEDAIDFTFAEIQEFLKDCLIVEKKQSDVSNEVREE